MTKIKCNEYTGFKLIRNSKEPNTCTAIRKIKKGGIIEKCPVCNSPAGCQLNHYTGKLKEDPVTLTIEAWKWRAETGEKYLYYWDKFVEINKLVGYCGFPSVLNEKICTCWTCKFYDKTKNIGECCFSGLYKEWQDSPGPEERKVIANKILDKIRKVYPKKESVF